MNQATLLSQVSDLLYQEADCLDAKRWQDWLDLYAPDCLFWMPSWINEIETTSDPETELNLLYLKGKEHLEDRVFRLQSQDSFASVPMDRTVHMISNVRILKQQDSVIEVKANWLVNSHGLHGTLLRGGHYEYQLLHRADRLKIVTKKVILINDKLVGPVDVFHV